LSGGRISRILSTVAALGLATTARAAEPQRAPPPDWVEPIAVDFEATRANERGGDAFTLLYDSRVRLSGKPYERYERRVRKALTAAGVDRLAEVLVQFDPERQKLVLHGIELHRGSQVIDQTRTARLRLVAEESELERRMYNGTVTAFIVLSDVRAGDALDLSYSLSGSEPLLEGRYAAAFSLSTSEVVRQRHIEVLTVGTRSELHSKLLGQPIVAASRAVSASSWDLRDVAPRVDEDRVPAPYQSSRLELSEFDSWRDVAAWGAHLYPSVTPAKEVAAQAAALTEGMSEPAEVALRLVRFVQDDVRYLAINNEGHGLSPHPAEKVLAQRFGDCKDKTYLLLQLLAARGIEARPMLVNSDEQAYVLEYHPTPYAFDHVILRATIAGKVHYLDATYAHQGGTLATQAGLDYGYGLVLAPDTTALEAIASPLLTAPNVRSQTSVVVLPDGSARLDVSTHFSGREADAKRRELSSRSLAEISETYANFYQSEFVDVEVVEPLRCRTTGTPTRSQRRSTIACGSFGAMESAGCPRAALTRTSSSRA
jgi:transglutaminase-like putative cysteine protease